MIHGTTREHYEKYAALAWYLTVFVIAIHMAISHTGAQQVISVMMLLGSPFFTCYIYRWIIKNKHI